MLAVHNSYYAMHDMFLREHRASPAKTKKLLYGNVKCWWAAVQHLEYWIQHALLIISGFDRARALHVYEQIRLNAVNGHL